MILCLNLSSIVSKLKTNALDPCEYFCEYLYGQVFLKLNNEENNDFFLFV